MLKISKIIILMINLSSLGFKVLQPSLHLNKFFIFSSKDWEILEGGTKTWLQECYLRMHNYMYSTFDVSQPMKSMVPDEDAVQGQRFSYLWHSKYMYLNNRKKKLKKT